MTEFDGATRAGLVPAIVECFGLRLDGVLPVGRLVSAQLDGDPDETAARAIGLIGSEVEGTAVLHSTSWRWQDGVGIVLTYVCAPDPLALDGVSVTPADGHPHDAAGPSHPGDGAPTMAQVLHHGIDHLAWLADHHPRLVEPAMSVAPELWTAILSAGRHRAGRIFTNGMPLRHVN